MMLIRQPSRRAAILLALFVVFLWATSWVLIKIGLEEIPALTFAGLRYTLGFLFLLPVFIIRRRARSAPALGRAAWGKLLLLGLLYYSLTQGASFVALDYLPAVTVNLLWSFSSGFVALLGVQFLKERMTLMQWSGIILAVFGALFYFYPASFPGHSLPGIVAAGIGVAANAGASILGRDINRSRSIDPLTVTVLSMGIGSIVLLVGGYTMQGLPQLSLQSWAIVVWLALVNTAFAFTLWNLTLQTLQATESSVINGTMMIWIPVLAVFFLDETLNIQQIAGLVLAGVGSLMVQLRILSGWGRASKKGTSDGV